MNRIHVRLGTYSGSMGSGPIWASGKAFYEDKLVSGKRLADVFATCEDTAAFIEKLRGLNGFFSIVKRCGKVVFAAVDHVRSQPLFYSQAGQTLIICDDPAWIACALSGSSQDPLAVAEFLLTGYVTGADTLDPRIKQLQAGEILIAEETSQHVTAVTKRYFQFSRVAWEGTPHDNLTIALAESFSGSIARLVKLAEGRQVVIPLSGGLDSRLIAAFVKASGIERVLTYTYGREGGRESKISQEISSALEMKWAFVPYNPRSWKQWFHSPERADYFRASHRLTSVPHIQDWPAVWELRNRHLLDDDAIFVPGHTGDFISGGHTLPGFAPHTTYPRRIYLDGVLAKHYNLWPIDRVLPDERPLGKRILERSGEACSPQLTGLEAVALHDQWDWQERQSKFIVNSLRSYEFWGFDWWMPMWDMEFVDFWQTVPYHARNKQNLYTQFVASAFANVSGWTLAKSKLTDRDSLTAKVLDLLRDSPLVPDHLVRSLKTARLRMSATDRHPMAWFGIIPQGLLRREYSGTQTINSFLAAYLIYDDWRAPEPFSLHET